MRICRQGFDSGTLQPIKAEMQRGGSTPYGCARLQSATIPPLTEADYTLKCGFGGRMSRSVPHRHHRDLSDYDGCRCRLALAIVGTQTSFADRQSVGAAAKKAALERHRDAAHDPALAGRQAARQAVKIARDGRAAERNIARVASKTHEAAEKVSNEATERATREAALQAKHAARQAEGEAEAASDLAREAEKQTALNTRKAARKAKKRKGR